MHFNITDMQILIEYISLNVKQDHMYTMSTEEMKMGWPHPAQEAAQHSQIIAIM